MQEHCESTGQGSCCSESSGSCGEQSCGCGSGQSAENCGCGGGCGDPLDRAIGSWMGAFFEAKREVEVDLMKARIQKAWGPRLEKAADAVFETVDAIWKSMLTKAEAKSKLKERFRSILFEGQK